MSFLFSWWRLQFYLTNRKGNDSLYNITEIYLFFFYFLDDRPYFYLTNRNENKLSYLQMYWSVFLIFYKDKNAVQKWQLQCVFLHMVQAHWQILIYKTMHSQMQNHLMQVFST